MFQSSTFGFAGVFPFKYTSVVLSGQVSAIAQAPATCSGVVEIRSLVCIEKVNYVIKLHHFQCQY